MGIARLVVNNRYLSFFTEEVCHKSIRDGWETT